MRRTAGTAAITLAVVLTALAIGPAGAHASSPPVLLSVGHQDRHPTATLGPLPGVDDATIYISTSSARASDGSFLSENIADLDFLTDQEIQSGTWLYESRLDPGTYYAMLRAADFDCSENPNCIDGLSNVLTLTIPKPSQRFTGSVEPLRFIGKVYLTLTVAPLGEDLPYRVCWTRTSGTRRCLRGTVNGYSWSSPADDSISASTRGMRRRTRFTWYVGGRRVASKLVKVR